MIKNLNYELSYDEDYTEANYLMARYYFETEWGSASFKINYMKIF